MLNSRGVSSIELQAPAVAFQAVAGELDAAPLRGIATAAQQRIGARQQLHRFKRTRHEFVGSRVQHQRSQFGPAHGRQDHHGRGVAGAHVQPGQKAVVGLRFAGQVDQYQVDVVAAHAPQQRSFRSKALHLEAGPQQHAVYQFVDFSTLDMACDLHVRPNLIVTPGRTCSSEFNWQ
jgi:hypothetical protein